LEVNREKETIEVRFDGWGNKYDEVSFACPMTGQTLKFSSQRIAFLRKFTQGKPLRRCSRARLHGSEEQRAAAESVVSARRISGGKPRASLYVASSIATCSGSSSPTLRS